VLCPTPPAHPATGTSSCCRPTKPPGRQAVVPCTEQWPTTAPAPHFDSVCSGRHRNSTNMISEQTNPGKLRLSPCQVRRPFGTTAAGRRALTGSQPSSQPSKRHDHAASLRHRTARLDGQLGCGYQRREVLNAAEESSPRKSVLNDYADGLANRRRPVGYATVNEARPPLDNRTPSRRYARLSTGAQRPRR
jgi:hypothetical protein